MNDRLKTIVDLEKYPIHDLNSPIIKNLVKKCKEDLDQHSCSTIPNFILPKSLKVMNSELEKQLDEVYMSKESINPYLYAKDDPSLPKDHPKRTFMLVEEQQKVPGPSAIKLYEGTAVHALVGGAHPPHVACGLSACCLWLEKLK